MGQMGDESDRMYDPLEDMSDEEVATYNADSFNMVRTTFQRELQEKSDTKILNKLTHDKTHKDFINGIVPSGRFKAFDIAMRLKKSGARLTPKQRKALINVLAHYETAKYL